MRFWSGSWGHSRGISLTTYFTPAESGIIRLLGFYDNREARWRAQRKVARQKDLNERSNHPSTFR